LLHSRIAGLERRAARLAQIRGETKELSRKLYELSLLHELWESAHSVQSVKGLLDSVLDTCMQMLKANAGSVFLYDKESKELVLSSVKGRMAESLQNVRRKLNEGVAGYVGAALEPLFVTDINKDARFKPSDSERHSGASFVSVPLVENNELLGVINLHDKNGGAPFEPQDLKQLLVAANYSASAIKKLGRHELLEEFNHELHSRLDRALENLANTSEELGRLKSYNESIVRSIPLGLLTFNRDFRITFCNQRTEEILCERPGSKNLLELDVAEKGKSWVRELQAVIELGSVARFDSATFVPASGDKSFVIRAIATPMRDPEDEIIGGVIVLEDITERVNMERLLAASERHAVIGKLAARVAHELNNPLDGILRFVNLSLSQIDHDERMQMYLQEARTGLERMAGIVGSLLEFSRNTHRPRRNTHVNEAIKEAIGSIRYEAEERSIEIKMDLAPNLSESPCDMTQMLLNLARNALDAMEGGGTFSIASALEDGQIVVTLSDTGTGMPESVRKRIFDPFFTTKEPGKGTGLGLAICHDMIQKYQGNIHVESEEGKGTTFTITLPAS
jgi:PAS domain S-box-containing protein